MISFKFRELMFLVLSVCQFLAGTALAAVFGVGLIAGITEGFLEDMPYKIGMASTVALLVIVLGAFLAIEVVMLRSVVRQMRRLFASPAR